MDDAEYTLNHDVGRQRQRSKLWDSYDALWLPFSFGSVPRPLNQPEKVAVERRLHFIRVSKECQLLGYPTAWAFALNTSVNTFQCRGSQPRVSMQ